MGQATTKGAEGAEGAEGAKDAYGAQDQTTVTAMTATEEEITETLQEFNQASKTGVGVHMFSFTPPGPPPHSGAQTIYVGSEVTDENDILDVKYTQWKKQYAAPKGSGPKGLTAPFTPPESKLKVIWTPEYHFTSGRTAMVAVKALLNNGYTMEKMTPETAE